MVEHQNKLGVVLVLVYSGIGPVAAFMLQKQLVAYGKKSPRLGHVGCGHVLWMFSLCLSGELHIFDKWCWNSAISHVKEWKISRCVYLSGEESHITKCWESNTDLTFYCFSWMVQLVNSLSNVWVQPRRHITSIFLTLLLQFKWGTNWNVSRYFCCKLKQISLYFQSSQ